MTADDLAPKVTKSQIRRRNMSGHLGQPLKGIYVIAGYPPSWRQDLAVLVGAGGLGTTVSHRAAAALHGVGRFPEILEVATPRTRRFRTEFKEAIIHTSIVLPTEDVTRLDGLVVTTVERTLLDLGAVASERRVQYAVDSALRDGLTTIESLWRLLAARRKRGRRGCGVLARVLESAGATGTPESRYERDFLALVQEMGLPTPVMQHRIIGRQGREFRLDFAWPEQMIAVEIDGHGYHATRAERASDSSRQNELQMAGWTVIRFTTDQIFSDSNAVATTMLHALNPPTFPFL